MNYSMCVKKAKLLVKNYDDLRYEISKLTVTVKKLYPEVTTEQFAKDIGLHPETVRNWVRYNEVVLKCLIENDVVKPNHNKKSTNNIICRMKSAGINDKASTIIAEFNRVKKRVENSKEVVNCEKHLLTLKNFMLSYDLSKFDSSELFELNNLLEACMEV